jgi:hypothetical protein
MPEEIDMQWFSSVPSMTPGIRHVEKPSKQHENIHDGAARRKEKRRLEVRGQNKNMIT